MHRTSATGQQLMLHSDMSLLKNIFEGNDDDVGVPMCSYSECTAASTAGLVNQLAANNTLFMTQFGDVYTRMGSNGYEACDLAVVPSTGFGVQADAEHGVSAVQDACAARGFAPAGTLVLGSPSGDTASPTGDGSTGADAGDASDDAPSSGNAEGTGTGQTPQSEAPDSAAFGSHLALALVLAGAYLGVLML